MNHEEVLARIFEVAIVPAVRLPTAELAIQAAKAIAAGGIPVVEVPLTVANALDAIRALRAVSDLVVGAGTVLDPDAARAATTAGAQFMVSPSMNLELIAFCRQSGIPILAGALTPSEIVSAWRAGADIVKVFPASAVGGPGYIKAVRAPFPEMRLMPMGGVTAETARAYLEAGAAVLGVGSDMVRQPAHATWDGRLTKARAREYVQVVADFRSGVPAGFGSR